jgi:hypothetical protein
MVRIHPDPPRQVTVVGWQLSVKASGRGCSSVGRAPALQAGGRRFDPVRLHQSGVRSQRTEVSKGVAPVLEPIDCGTVFSSVFCENSELKAVCSLTIREGKAHSGLMRFRMRRVELYLARARDTKGARAGWRKHTRSEWLWALDGGRGGWFI